MAKTPSDLEIQDIPVKQRSAISFYAIITWIVAICGGMLSVYYWTTVVLQPFQLLPENPAWMQFGAPVIQLVLGLLASDSFTKMANFSPRKSSSLLYLVPIVWAVNAVQSAMLFCSYVVSPTYEYSLDHSIGFLFLAMAEFILLVLGMIVLWVAAAEGTIIWTRWNKAMQGDSTSYTDVGDESD